MKSIHKNVLHAIHLYKNTSILHIYIATCFFSIDQSPYNACLLKGIKACIPTSLPDFLFVRSRLVLQNVCAIEYIYSIEDYFYRFYRTLTRSLSLPCLFNYEAIDHEDM